MPYIIPSRRKDLVSALRPILAEDLSDAELNFVITALLLSTHPATYKHYNALVGVLEYCKLELYQQRIAPYEETNSDVY